MRKINSIKGFEMLLDRYYITTCGRVYSKNMDKIMKTFISNTGYERITLRTKDKKSKKISVHRIVALAFLDKKVFEKEVNHINEIKTINHILNLEWTTSSLNKIHSRDKYLKSQKRFSKLSDKQVLEILSSNLGVTLLAKKYKVDSNVIYKIKNGTGYKWVKRA